MEGISRQQLQGALGAGNPDSRYSRSFQHGSFILDPSLIVVHPQKAFEVDPGGPLIRIHQLRSPLIGEILTCSCLLRRIDSIQEVGPIDRTRARREARFIFAGEVFTFAIDVKSEIELARQLDFR
ncbi:hypothetical protein [Kocuria marina]|uniref:hypothetical protein n=1 Tax=Kocuria marina TaxID=223184 RepID=UPI0022E7F38C|nr:hypothetical protein [Kocuria marina]